MKNATIALLTATALALASLQAAAESKRGGGMAPTGKGSGPGTMKQPYGSGAAAGQGQPQHDMMRPGGRATKSNKAPKKRAQPYCPQGRKADGTCWGRCSQVICL